MEATTFLQKHTVEPLLSSHPGEMSILVGKGGGCSAEVLSHEQFLNCWRKDLAIHSGMMLTFNHFNCP